MQERLTCPDGGACHHYCSEPCARRDKLACVPLTLSGLADDWTPKRCIQCGATVDPATGELPCDH